MKEIIYRPNRLAGLLFVATAFFFIHSVGSCKKEVEPPPPQQPSDKRITSSYTEEFESVYALLTDGGWTSKDYEKSGDLTSTPSSWGQGFAGMSKDGSWNGFTAYSWSPTTSYAHTSEFAYSYLDSISSQKSTSSWMITPILTVKNGDVISFYTRGDTTGNYTDRLQVLMNKSTSTEVGNALNSPGSFTTIMFDINANQVAGGFPTTWTKYEYTFSGLAGKTDTRVAFRHYLTNPANGRGVGIDLFRFIVK